MTETYDKLKAMLEEKKSLSNEDVEKMEAEHGKMTDEEKFDLEAKKLELAKADKKEEVTLEEYQAALKILDAPGADESSEEYKKAEAIADKYESQ
jgi:hypothetical protein